MSGPIAPAGGLDANGFPLGDMPSQGDDEAVPFPPPPAPPVPFPWLPEQAGRSLAQSMGLGVPYGGVAANGGALAVYWRPLALALVALGAVLLVMRRR